MTEGVTTITSTTEEIKVIPNSTVTSQNNLESQVSNQVPATSIVDQLVGEGKKFKDIDGLAIGKLEADKFILKLQEENQTLRNQLYERNTMEDILSSIKEVSQQQQQQPSNETQVQEPAPAGLDLEQEIVRVLSQREKTTRREQNLAEVNKGLLTLGNGDVEKAKAVVKEAADKLGLSADYLIDVGGQSPRAFFNLISPVKESQPMGVVNSLSSVQSVNTTSNYLNSSLNSSNSFDNSPDGKRLAELKSLMKTNMNQFLSSQVQSELNNLYMKKFELERN